MLQPPKCFERQCKHYWGVIQSDPDEEGSEFCACRAFPEGIPEDIAYGDDPHTEVHLLQDNTILYEKKEEQN